MDLDQLWAEANASLPDNISNLQIQQAMILESNNHIAELAKRIKHQRNYAIAFLIGFFILIPKVFSHQVALICLMVVIVFYMLAALQLHMGWKKIQNFNSTQLSAKESINSQLNTIKRTLKLNNLWGFGAMPIILVAALVGSWAYRTGAGIDEMMLDIAFWKKAAFAGIILLPLGYGLSVYLTRQAFDKLYAELASNLDAIRKLDTEARSNA